MPKHTAWSHRHAVVTYLVVLAFVLSGVAGCGNEFAYTPQVLTDVTTSPGRGPTVAGDRDGGPFQAGVAKVDATPPVGVPLAGFGAVPRRLILPDLLGGNDYTFLTPSVGVKDPIFVKALVVSNGQTTAAMVTADVIAIDRQLVELAHTYAAEQGVPIPFDNVLFCASHTHSGPGVLSQRIAWQLIVSDVFRPDIYDQFAKHIAEALIQAYRQRQPARFGVGAGQLIGVTRNRREHLSPETDADSIDPQVGVIRIDRPDGTALAVLWNFAVHGLAWGRDNLEYSADIMGAASDRVENRLGCVALFANGAEGDVNPIYRDSAERIAEGASIMADEILAVHEAIDTTDIVMLRTVAEAVDFGTARVDISIPHWLDPQMPHGDYDPQMTLPMGPQMIDNVLPFQAIRLNDTVLVAVPGEPITALGRQIKDDGYAMGFPNVFLIALANGHMGYITTEREYRYGGYEALATFWGPATGEHVRNACRRQMQALR